MRNLLAAALIVALSCAVADNAQAQFFYGIGSIGRPGVTLWSGGGYGSWGYRYGYSYNTYYAPYPAYGYYGAAYYRPMVLGYADGSTASWAYAPPRMRVNRYAYTTAVPYVPVARPVAPACYGTYHP